MASVPVLLRARLDCLPLPLEPVPASVFEVVFADCVAEVLWLVVPLGAIVTVLFGIALKRASVLTVVLAFGVVDWFAVVPVLLPAWLVV